MTRRDWLIAAALVSLVAVTLAYVVKSQDAAAWVLREKRTLRTFDRERDTVAAAEAEAGDPSSQTPLLECI